MPETAIAELNLQSWDTISASYQAGARIATDGVHYGPLAPGEQKLCLLGDVRSKQVILTNLRQAFVEAWRVLKVVYSLPEKERLRWLDA